MKKLLLAIFLMSLACAIPAAAQTQDKHALGDMYTKALNALEAGGWLDTMEPAKHVKVTDIHTDHGQVFLTLEKEDGAEIVIYDMMTGKIMFPRQEVQ